LALNIFRSDIRRGRFWIPIFCKRHGIGFPDKSFNFR